MANQISRCNSVSKFIISCLYEAQRVSGTTPPIIRSLKLHSGFAYVKSCWTLRLLDAVSVQQLHVQQPFTYAKPEAASAVLGS